MKSSIAVTEGAQVYNTHRTARENNAYEGSEPTCFLPTMNNDSLVNDEVDYRDNDEIATLEDPPSFDTLLLEQQRNPIRFWSDVEDQTVSAAPAITPSRPAVENDRAEESISGAPDEIQCSRCGKPHQRGADCSWVQRMLGLELLFRLPPQRDRTEYELVRLDTTVPLSLSAYRDQHKGAHALGNDKAAYESSLLRYPPHKNRKVAMWYQYTKSLPPPAEAKFHELRAKAAKGSDTDTASIASGRSIYSEQENPPRKLWERIGGRGQRWPPQTLPTPPMYSHPAPIFITDSSPTEFILSDAYGRKYALPRAAIPAWDRR
jgi:hypothetical protein